MSAEKREQMTLAILPSVISAMTNARGAVPFPKEAVRVAVDYADALLGELAKKPETPP